jgi:nitrous oxidase accessory protein
MHPMLRLFPGRGSVSVKVAFVLLVGCALARPATAATWTVRNDQSLNTVIAQALAGDVIRLAVGIHSGPVRVDRSLTLLGETGTVIDGAGQGTVVTVDAPDVAIRGLTIRNSGARLSTEDSGIFVTARGDRALIEGNRLELNLIGIYLKGPQQAVVRANTVRGRRDLRMNERGNGIHLWNTPGSVVEGNDVRWGRDGIFVTTSRDNKFSDNRFRDLRFAVHYMYTNSSEISGNHSLGNHIGYALMYSTNLTVYDNVSDGDRDRGILFNFANNSQIYGNRVRPGPDKCVFIYNSNINRLHHNHFEGCEIGVHFTAGSERNEIWANAFVANRTQVKYVGTRHLEWSRDGSGNYWSDHTAFDLDADGLADQPYRPNDLVDQIMWRHPVAKLLLSSPAVQLLRWAQRQFPALLPGGVVDSAPLMAPPGQTAGNPKKSSFVSS